MNSNSFKILLVLIFSSVLGFSSDTIFTVLPDLRGIDTNWMQTVFVEDFNGNMLNPKVWVIEDGTRGAGDHENSPQNIQIENGILKLIARSFPGKVDTAWNGVIYTRGFTTAEIWTRWNRYLYGSFEARCKMPKGLGLWFAYWLHGPGGDGYPEDNYGSEIDIAEADCNQTPVELINAIHYWLPDGSEMKILDRDKGYPNLYMDEWHVFKLIWTPYEVSFYIDGVKRWDRTKFSTGGNFRFFDVPVNEIRKNTSYYIHEWFPRHHMSTVLQMALDSTIVGNEKILPATMEIDYVKVKQFFRSPFISCPDTIRAATTAILDTDNQANEINWELSPSGLFTGLLKGAGKSAFIEPSLNSVGDGKITYSFRMPSGETFKAVKKVRINSKVVASYLTPLNTNDYIMSIYPNPSGEVVNIEMNCSSGNLGKSSWHGTIYNQFNQAIRTNSGFISDIWKIDTSDWAPGIYIARIQVNGDLLVEKFAVVK